ncbi:sensor histidine kinase [Paenibacillus glycanilyticus]|nr:sensor histidine kinase [Paenibacillus glycanilyticus]
MTTTARFFTQNLLIFLLPMLIPLVVLGALSAFLIQQYAVNEINNRNTNMLKQTKENIELLFNEQQSLNLHIIASATQFMNLKSMLNKPRPTAADEEQLAALKNFIDSPSIAQPYIDSIYIYLRNDNKRFISSVSGGFLSLEEDPDRTWYASYEKHAGDKDIWTESRIIPRYNLNKQLVNNSVITMYRNFKVRDNTEGVIVLNIKRQYIERRLNDLSTLKGQKLLVVDEFGSVMFGNDARTGLKSSEIKSIIAHANPSFSITAAGEAMLINKMNSVPYNWTFISVSPKKSLYTTLQRLLTISGILLSLSLIAASLLAYKLTQKNYRDLKLIISILDAAEKGKPLPVHRTRKNSMHSQIIRSLLQNFIEHNYIRIQLSESQYKTKAAEFAALQSQLNPHFLYNTLETIHWKAAKYTDGPNELTGMVEHLSDILRYSLEGQSSLVPLRVEIANTKSYVAIQRIRHGKQFDIWWEYDAELEEFEVLKLIFQPLIENSLEHGLRPGSKISIKIKIQRQGSQLRLAVIDNGNGITPERMMRIRMMLQSDSPPTNHIGLINTQRRIQLAYGHRGELQIKSKPGRGTLIAILLPINE